ncbi:MAG: ATP-binding protein [Sporichthyaceae bacterium]
MSDSLRPRAVAARIVEALADTPVVVVNGPRQSGKSTLVANLPYRGSYEIATLDDPVARAVAREDPRSFLDRQVDTFVIDEAQLEPGLFRAIKAEVDRDRRPGRFVLTGSSRLLSAPDMADSLVGRVEAIELWPFAERELLAPGSTPFAEAAFDDPRALVRSGTTTRRELLSRLAVGGFPEAIARSAGRRRAWFEAYVQTITQRVVGEIARIERVAELPRLVRLCAARTATELNVANVASEFGVPARTVDGYLAHLQTSFLIRLIPAWSTNVSAKVVRRPKLLLADVGLAAHLVGAGPESLTTPGAPVGPLLETFVGNELERQLSWAGENIGLWHFRDRDGHEVDFVLEHPDGRVVGIEVKASMTPGPSAAGGLRLLADRLGDRFAYGFLLTAAPEATPLGPRLAAIPVSALWTEPV